VSASDVKFYVLGAVFGRNPRERAQPFFTMGVSTRAVRFAQILVNCFRGRTHNFFRGTNEIARGANYFVLQGNWLLVSLAEPDLVVHPNFLLVRFDDDLVRMTRQKCLRIVGDLALDFRGSTHFFHSNILPRMPYPWKWVLRESKVGAFPFFGVAVSFSGAIKRLSNPAGIMNRVGHS
jgi:hypothetical protein